MAILPVVETFEIAELGLRFVDFQAAPAADVLAGKEILWGLLQGEILNQLRPGVSLCRPSPGVADTGCDPDLDVANFVVYAGPRVVGAFNIYDLAPNPDAPGLSGKACPGIRHGDVPATWAVVIRWIEENDLASDGRPIDIEWDFPDFPGHSWTSDERADAVVAELESRGHVVTRRADGSPAKVRRTRP